MFAALFEAMRPRQWLKNVLVMVSPLVAGDFFELHTWVAMAIAFIAFCMASSATYLFNDVVDVDADRQHPEKRNRPMASGRVSIRVACIASAVLAVLALVLCVATSEWGMLLVICIYLLLQVAYSKWLKHVTLVDIAIISSGFLLRAMAGGIVTDVGLSQWFLLVAGFGSLLMAAGKRYSELTYVELLAEAEVGATRRVLVAYSGTYLRMIVTASISVLIACYSLWAFEMAQPHDGIWAPLSIVPFSLAVLRYAFAIDRGMAASPESVVIKDHSLQVFAALWLAAVMWGIYLN